MNIEHKKIFITGLMEWHNQLIIRKNELEEEKADTRTSTDRHLYLGTRIDKINEMIINIKNEIKQQKHDCKHYIGI